MAKPKSPSKSTIYYRNKGKEFDYGRIDVLLDPLTVKRLRKLVKMSGCDLTKGGTKEVITQAIWHLYDDAKKKRAKLDFKQQQMHILANTIKHLQSTHETSDVLGLLNERVRVPSWLGPGEWSDGEVNRVIRDSDRNLARAKRTRKSR